jgi:pilus assembly protein CpaE
MPDVSPAGLKTRSSVVLFSDDTNFVLSLQSAFDADIISNFSFIGPDFNCRTAVREVRDAGVVIIDLRVPDGDLLEFQRFMTEVGNIPVIVVIDQFSETVARKLIRMRIADILVKPVSPIELFRACTCVARAETEEAQIYTFLPVAGGVGVTTLAIQSALTLLAAKNRPKRSTCLLDLNFYQGACTNYLDIEPRLNLKEIELKPERLDRQLLEGMVSRHSSGLHVIATGSLPTETAVVAPHIVMRLLNVLCQSFDQIVIDMPRSWHLWTDNIILGSNKLFLVSEATVPSIWKAKELVESISTKLGQRANPRVIVNRFERRFFSSALRRADIEKTLGEAFFGTVPYNFKLVRESIDRGAPIDDIQKGSNVAAAIKRIVLPRPARTSSLLPLSRAPTLNWAWHGNA